MSRQGIDDLIREWTDLGEEHLPERYLRAAIAEVETTRQIGARRASLEGLILRFQSSVPYLAVAAAAVAAIALYVAFSGQPVGNQNPSPTASPASTTSSAAATPSASPSPLVTELRFDLSTPYGTAPADGWFFEEVVGDRLDEGLRGYRFLNGNYRTGTGFRVTIYLDPAAEYAGSWDTTRDDLVVAVEYNRPITDGTARGNFETVSDECQITFDQFTATAATGSLECAAIPGTHAIRAEPRQDGVVDLSGSFAFDPSVEPS